MDCPICNNKIKAHHKVVSVTDPLYYRDYNPNNRKSTLFHESCFNKIYKRPIRKDFNQTTSKALMELFKAANIHLTQTEVNNFVAQNPTISNPVDLFKVYFLLK